MNHAYIYIVTNRPKGSLYIGVTSDLVKRIGQHKNSIIKGHTSKYNLVRLVYFELFDDIENAIKREKRLKEWKRAWKIHLIERMNPL